MIQRCYDLDVVRNALAPYPELLPKNFDYEEWIEDTTNIILQEGDSLGMFSHEYPGVFSGHYFFKARGKEALTIARNMLVEIFTNYGAKMIKGTTPVNNKGAMWMNRQLGFTSHGIIEDPVNGDGELFCLSLDEFFHTLNKKETD